MSVALEGDRISGAAVRGQNVTAAMSVANVVRSSLGPVGLDKMLVDDIGDVTITNDGATILKLLEVEHPAAKILCDLANVQDQEIGDGTTSVVLIAAELLKNAETLIKNGLHPTSVISGYRMAAREACRYLKENLTIPSSKLGDSCLLSVAKTSMSSKIISTQSDFFGNLVVKAANLVREGSTDKSKCDINKINILKAHGGKMVDSMFVDGFALNCTVASEAMPKILKNVKIALLEFGFQKARMGTNVQVLINDPTKLEAIRKEEIEITMRKIKLVLDSGANLVLCSGGIDDLCLKPFVEAKAMAVRRVTKQDLKRIAGITGGTVCLSLSNMDGGESFESSNLGFADEVEQFQISDRELILIKSKKNLGGSFILRGANDFLCDEMERSIHDALSAVKRVIQSNSVVAGGGAVETALSANLDNFACGISTKEQLPISYFADALLVIPKTLALNAALDASDIVGDLRTRHAKACNNQSSDDKWCGLDLNTGIIRNNVQAGVFEPSISKIKILKFATEAAITILRIDDLITLAPIQKDPRQDEDECC